MGKTAPGPKGNLIFGSLPTFSKNSIRFFVDSFRDYGNVTKFRLLHIPCYFLAHPDDIKYVLQERNRDFGKQTVGWDRMREVVGHGLLTSEGDIWLRQRRLIQPLFHRQKLNSFTDIMTNATLEMLQNWQQKNIQKIDVLEEMMRISLKIVGDTLIGSDIDSNKSQQVAEAISIVLSLFNERLMRIVRFPDIIPTHKNRIYHDSIRRINKIVLEIIQKRRQTEQQDSEDVLSRLITAQDAETGEKMNDQQLLDEVMSIFLAGHETTANATTWTWLMLARHPEIREQLYEEIVSVLGDRPLTLEDLPKLTFADMVIREVMRIYPPVWTTSRSALVDTEIAGYPVKKGTIVFVSQYVTHRHPDFWENPEGFYPQRFASGDKIHKFAYFPFGGGPHICIGNNFALLSTLIIIVTVMQRYQINLEPVEPLEMELSITLRPKTKLTASLQKRK